MENLKGMDGPRSTLPVFIWRWAREPATWLDHDVASYRDRAYSAVLYIVAIGTWYLQ